MQSILGGETTDPPRIDGPPRQVGLFDFVSVIFPTLDAKLTFQDLMQVPFTCLGPRTSGFLTTAGSTFRHDGQYVFAMFFVLIFGMG